MDDLFLTNVKSKIYVCTRANISMKLNIFKNGKCSSVLCMMWFCLRLLFCFIISHRAYISLLPHAPHRKWSESQSYLTLCDPMDYTVHGILQARILEQAAFPFSRGSSQPRDWNQVSCIVGGLFTSWATKEASHWPHPTTLTKAGGKFTTRRGEKSFLLN